METKTVYFEKPGGENTDAVLKLVKERAETLGIKTIIVASNTGETALKALDICQGLKVISVSHSTGWLEPNKQELPEENRKAIESKGGTIVTAAHALGGISRAFRQGDIPQAPATYVVGDLIASTLRIFSQGVKVGCEIALMAADAGVVRTDEEAITIAGTGRAGRGADTAMVVQPANAHRVFDMVVKELICKPRL